jgi:hypothetical protein
MKKNYIVVGTCAKLLRQVLLAINSKSNANCIVIGGENTRNLRWTSLCSKNVVLNFDKKDQRNDDQLFANLVNEFASKFPGAVLIPADCEGTRMINRVRSQLRIKMIPYCDLATLDMLDNKWRFFEFCTANDLMVPPTIYIGNKSNLNFASLANRFGLPFVIKPVNQAGSNGVHIVRSEEFFNQVIRDNEAYQFDTLIAQKYIAGIDLCFNFLAMNGEISAFSIQQRVGSTIRFLTNPALEKLGRQLAKAATYNGVMCIDARVEESTGNVFLIESNPRFWASLGASVWCGMNFVMESVEAIPRPHQPRTITTGIFHERHPVLRPSAWTGAIFDLSEHGRILRANMRDFPVVAGVFQSLSTKAWKRAMHHITSRRSIGSSGRSAQ